MAIKIYQGNDTLFLTAWKLATRKYREGKEFVPPPPKRQYTKWKEGRGLAFSKKEEAKKLLKIS